MPDPLKRESVVEAMVKRLTPYNLHAFDILLFGMADDGEVPDECWKQCGMTFAALNQMLHLGIIERRAGVITITDSGKDIAAMIAARMREGK